MNTMTPEQWHILNSKPLERMRRFASLLNWRGLQLEWHIVSPEEGELPKITDIIAFYMTPDLKFNLQINEIPLGQSVTHQASVVAFRYSILNIGWHRFALHEDDEVLRAETERLRPWLDRKLFKSRSGLKGIKRMPATTLITSRKKQRGGPKH